MGVLAGERECVRIPGFDLGNSPREFVEPHGDTVILTTTNGTRALVAAASRCERVLAGSLLNLEAVAGAARSGSGGVAVVCAGVLGELAMDDAYCAGRLAELLGGQPTDAASASMRLARSFPDAEEGLAASQSARNPPCGWARGRHRVVRAREHPRHSAGGRRVARRRRRRAPAAIGRISARFCLLVAQR